MISPPNNSLVPSLGEVEKEVTIFIGGVHASQEPIVITTLLGSCIAVCLFDQESRVGGMNHFMLPRGESGAGADATRFGVHAMDRLIGDLLKVGANRGRLVAKVFGGAHVLDVGPSQNAVPQQNIEFIRVFLEKEGFPVLSEDVGGTLPRSIRFHTGTNQVFVRKLDNAQLLQQLRLRERQKEKPPPFGAVVLFDREE